MGMSHKRPVAQSTQSGAFEPPIMVRLGGWVDKRISKVINTITKVSTY